MSQVLTYAVARSFYLEFGIEPSAIGISPLNSAFAFSYTWVAIYALVVQRAVPLILFSVALWGAWQTGRYMRLREGVSRDKMAKLTLRQRVAGVNEWRQLEVRYRREKRLLECLELFAISPGLRIIFRIVTALLILLSLLSASVGVVTLYASVATAGVSKARDIGKKRPVKTDEPDLKDAASLDLSAPVVHGKWIGLPDRRPLGVPSGSTYFVGALIGTLNGQHVIVIQTEIDPSKNPPYRDLNSRPVVYVATSDVALSGLGIRS
ncbi:hypothetical protein [Pseudonocardia alni]|uniref:hypothetical protein n=1 Tax=Pseudonocardia alni TaxID=33907 RepID=UPI003326F237